MFWIVSFICSATLFNNYKWRCTEGFLASPSIKTRSVPQSTFSLIKKSAANKKRHHHDIFILRRYAFQNFTDTEHESLPMMKTKDFKKTNDKIKSSETADEKRGKITMVGSGPGDPNLLTMAAYSLLTESSSNQKLIISDRLVSKEILDLIPRDNIEVKVANKNPGCAENAQEEIYHWAAQGLQEGKHVIRLKIGDPFVFGRGGEEVLRFREMGYEPSVIPGVSASLSAPLLGGIPITHRGISNQVVMCTGYGRNGTSPELIQYHKEQTVVFLMAVGRLRDICHNLITLANYPEKTPVAIVEKAGCGEEQRTIIGNLLTIADIAAEWKVVAPSTIIVGECVHVLLEDYGCEEKFVSGLIPSSTEQVDAL